jgi:hypothetical protein
MKHAKSCKTIIFALDKLWAWLVHLKNLHIKPKNMKKLNNLRMREERDYNIYLWNCLDCFFDQLYMIHSIINNNNEINTWSITGKKSEIKTALKNIPVKTISYGKVFQTLKHILWTSFLKHKSLPWYKFLVAKGGKGWEKLISLHESVAAWWDMYSSLLLTFVAKRNFLLMHARRHYLWYLFHWSHKRVERSSISHMWKPQIQ